jgi:hypothetical protein
VVESIQSCINWITTFFYTKAGTGIGLSSISIVSGIGGCKSYFKISFFCSFVVINIFEKRGITIASSLGIL